MTGLIPDLTAALTDLQARTSRVRRSAAKRLRRLKDPTAGPALLDALRREVQDRRTWETQYQMIMALGETGHQPALPYLRQLAGQHFEATAVYTALGDAIVRLGRQGEQDPTPVLDLLATSNPMLINGAFRAVAMLQLTLDSQAVDAIMHQVSNLALDDPLRFWVAVAAHDWSGLAVERFLAACAMSPRKDIRTAALEAQRRKYLRWAIL